MVRKLPARLFVMGMLVGAGAGLLGAGDASFFTLPFILYDAFYDIAFTAGFQPRLAFENDGTFRVRDSTGANTPIPTLPLQWFEFALRPPALGVYSVRSIVDAGPDPWNGPSPTPALGVWTPIVSGIAWDMLAFPFGQERNNTTTFQMALTADLIPKAQATIRLRCTRV